MSNLRRPEAEGFSSLVPCSRCAQARQRWDRIAGKAYCPDCLEGMALGEGDPLVERTSEKRCAICEQAGTLCYVTFPLRAPGPVEMDLCAEHLRSLVGRRLEPTAFRQLSRRLSSLGITSEEIFLLHDAFYDRQGRALQPALEQC
jgi:hypothetical protein